VVGLRSGQKRVSGYEGFTHPICVPKLRRAMSGGRKIVPSPGRALGWGWSHALTIIKDTIVLCATLGGVM
jgi:hypothetical protein